MKQLIMDAAQLDERLCAMADAMAALATQPEQVAILGIRTRGAIMAQRLQQILVSRNGLTIPVGLLDISLYRDDLSQLAIQPLVRRTQLDFDINDKLILLIDDVLYTGRTIRAAIDEIIDFGRPRAIKLLVLVDRGGRELPIQADYVSHTIEVDEEHVIKVCLSEVDAADQVILTERASIKSEA